jgi:hypothetical protein
VGTIFQPSLEEKSSWLMALPQHYHIVPQGLWFPDPSARDPELLSSQAGESEWQQLLVPVLSCLDVGLMEMTKPGFPLQEPLQAWFVAFLTPIGKTKQPHTQSQSLIGLIKEAPTGLCFFFF